MGHRPLPADVHFLTPRSPTRPVLRPSHELQQNHALLPSTPPNSAEEMEARRRERIIADLSHTYDGTYQTSPPKTPTRNPAINRSKENVPYMKSSPPVPQARHQRSRSYSTAADGHHHVVGKTARPIPQVRIDQCDGPAAEDLRPRTAGHQKSFQTLDVQIPHYNLGSPRFSPNGTPFLLGSSSLHLTSTTGEMGSSHASPQQSDGRWLWSSIDPRALSPSPAYCEINSAIPSATRAPPRISTQTTIPENLAPSFIVTSTVMAPIPLIPSPPIPVAQDPADIGPEIYDQLSFPPGSDDPTVVRYDPYSQEITAAIPARIIAQITSSTFVDYHLLSDFFLTYRLFMNARDLAAHLMARLQWAIDRGDDTGKVVRVRTFVAIRHWLLNYFADDFVPHLLFRQEFVETMNQLADEVRSKGNVSDLKIIGELKKCWRRTCVLYWDIPDSTEADLDKEIVPGGPPGTRNDKFSLAGSATPGGSRLSTPPPRLDLAPPDHSSGTESFIRDVVQPRGGIAMFERKDGSQPKENNAPTPTQSHPRSAQSSITERTESATRHAAVKKKKAISAHSSLVPGKKIRGGPHKRSGSFSDALRDNRYPLPLPNSIAKSTQLLIALPYANSLVRGNLFPPTPAFVEVIAPSTPNELDEFDFGLPNSSMTTINQKPPVKVQAHNKTSGGPGMKKLFVTVRKVLGGSSASGKSSNLPSERHLAVPSARLVRSASTRSNTSVLQSMSINPSKFGMRMSGDGKVARIDLLGAGAVDAFQRAMAENEPHSEVARLDGTGDIKTYVGAEMEGTMTTMEAELRRLSKESNHYNCGGFLDSPSTPGSSPAAEREHVDSLLSGISFLADDSGPSSPSRNSVAEDQTAAITSQARSYGDSLRRSKSFSFDRLPPQSDIDARSLAFTDGRSLRSVRSLSYSFDLGRANSGLSQFSSMVGNISDINKLRVDGYTSPPGLLRRRPGGNLRAAATVGSLGQPRPMSTGSISTGKFSLEGAPDLQMRPRQRAFSPGERSSEASGPQFIAAGVVSLGAMGGSELRHPSTVLEVPQDSSSTEASAEDNKTTFEAGVQMLRELPDDECDDGGVEVALAKLEGTFQRKKSEATSPFRMSIGDRLGSGDLNLGSPETQSGYGTARTTVDGTYDEDGDSTDDHQKRMKRRIKQVLDQVPLPTPPVMYASTLERLHRGLSGGTFHRRNKERVFSSGPFRRRKTEDNAAVDGTTTAGSSSFEMDLDRVDSRLEMHLESSLRRRGYDSESDLSSEPSFQQSGDKSPTSRTISPRMAMSELQHPRRHLPSPPMTRPSDDSGPLTPRYQLKAGSFDLDVNMSPRSRNTQNIIREDSRKLTSRDSEVFIPTSIHLPFILAYDSELLAKQFTLIEKDALLEIDWKELVELSWSQTDADVKDWVELLNSRDIKGVEVVIARFNLVS